MKIKPAYITPDQAADALNAEFEPRRRIRILIDLRATVSKMIEAERERVHSRKRVPGHTVDPNEPRFATGEMREAYEMCLAQWAGTTSSVTDYEFLGTGRRGVVPARWAWVALCREMGFSYTEIARSMGRTNHSTAITAMQEMELGRSVNAGNARALLAIARRAWLATKDQGERRTA